METSLYTDRRLLQGMNLPRRRGPNYRHGRCEGGMAGVSAYYTLDYVKHVAEFMVLEHDYRSLQQELGVQDTLPIQFGHGPVCVCTHVKHHGSQLECGSCSLERRRKEKLMTEASKQEAFGTQPF